MASLGRSDALLVVGSSLMVHSGYRYATGGAPAGIPVAAVNLGRTRADHLLTLKVEAAGRRDLASLHAPVSGPDYHDVAGDVAERVNRHDWDAYADEYQAEHGDVPRRCRLHLVPRGG